MKQRKSYDFSAIGHSIQQKMAERDAYVFHERPAVIKAALLLTFDPETMEMEDEDRRFLEASCSWDVRGTSDEEIQTQFYGVCKAIHSYFTAGTDEYPDFVARLAEVNVDRFSLVLRA
jgi:hypothetical protein